LTDYKQAMKKLEIYEDEEYFRTDPLLAALVAIKHKQGKVEQRQEDKKREELE
jgi:6-pyruvoyl-tetrahydropterin synthase